MKDRYTEGLCVIQEALCLQAKNKESERLKKWAYHCAESKVWEEI